VPSKAKTVPADKEPIGDDRIKDVWVDNFLQELEQVASLVDQYNYISMVSQTLTNNSQDAIINTKWHIHISNKHNCVDLKFTIIVLDIILPVD
jgi:hypothetical protein